VTTFPVHNGVARELGESSAS